MFKSVKTFAMVALLAATALMFASCSKDAQIVGKWKITRAASSDWTSVSDDRGETWTFKEKGKGTVIITGSDFDMTWSISSDNLTLDVDGVYLGGEKVRCTGDFVIDELKSKTMTISGNWILKSEGTQVAKHKVTYEFDKK